MRSRRNPWNLVVLLLVCALIGGIIGEFLSRYQSLSWMSFGGVNGYKDLVSFSLNPAIDTRVLKLGFSFSLSVNMGSIIGMILGMVIYFRI